MDQEPPPYVPQHSRRPRPLTLPSYSLASAPSIAQSLSTPYQSEHQYSLENSKGLPWASLHIRSRSPSSHSLPLYFEHDVISGSVSLDLGKPDGIRGVMITVQAGATGVGQRLEIFMETSQTLWSQPSGKLQGNHTWPFSITLPREIAISESRNAPPRVYQLPPRFSERGSLAHIDYKLFVTIRRGILSVNSTLSTNFVYLPNSVAEQPSALREVAYREGSALPGPQEDPEGWKVLSAVELKGHLFGSRPVALTYTLAIAAPLSFAANTPIPLFLTVCSDDDVAIDLLSHPQAIVVYLIRTLTIFDNPRNWRAPTFDDAMGRAVFWLADEHLPRRGTRRLWGELHLRKGLKQSFTFSKFSVRYAISLYPSKAAGFVPSSPPYQALISEDITVTLRNYPGVTPRSYMPPGTVLPDEGERSGASARFHYTGDMDTFTLQ
ncbi:hypothetical protein DENSPDRAFT_884883 [Dentipellis sp. KUC8613]|nr:hypothetical protein DENSPDRAFT_884883 [Dentipellis sp. KUC8613]